MSSVTKHDSEQERECDASVDGRVDFFVAWHSILIDYDLEILCELICFKHCWWIELFCTYLLDL